MPETVLAKSFEPLRMPVFERRTELQPGSRLYGPEDVLGSLESVGWLVLGSPLADFLTVTFFYVKFEGYYWVNNRFGCSLEVSYSLF